MTEPTDNRLRLFVERIERINEEVGALQGDRKDIYAEAKAVGYDTRMIRQLVARRKMKPEDRAEADALLQTYEAALGGDAPDPAIAPDEQRRALAIAMLEEQIEGVQDVERAELLARHVLAVLDIRAEIADLRTMEKNRKAMAEVDGFEQNPLSALVRWIEKCAKHGRDAMRASEATFQMYRGTFERVEGVGEVQVTKDPALQKLIGAPKQNKSRSATDAWLNSGAGN